MPSFQVSSVIPPHPDPEKKRISRARHQGLVILRYVNSVAIAGALFGLSLAIVRNDILFVLLPVGVSVIVTTLTSPSRVSAVRSLLLLTVVTLAYFSAVTGFEMLTHPPATPEIIVVTTTLTIAVIFQPVRTWIQGVLERRFGLDRNTYSVALETVSSALREEIDLNQVRDQFFDVLQRTLHPASLSFWVSGPASREWASTVVVPDDDPFLAHALQHTSALELDWVRIDSPLVRNLRADGVEVVVPLASEGVLLGLLLLGPRLRPAREGASRFVEPLLDWASLFSLLRLVIVGPGAPVIEYYGREERALLDALAAQGAPAIRVAQLVDEQKTQVRERERVAQELRTAQEIQRTFLPKEVPAYPGWELTPYYQPAREVGGDFYDILPFEHGSVGLVLGDVTGKGIPAALVMTATRTMLRTAAREMAAPGDVLARVNELLCADIPSGMFVTCFYAVLDPDSGHIHFANAGQDYPYVRQSDGVGQLRAAGMPLGLMPGMRYDEREITLAAGDSLLFFSDGLVEAHNPEREMFGLPRVEQVVAAHPGGPPLIDTLLGQLKTFTGTHWEQEDDITLLTLRRAAPSPGSSLS